jgi:hypothetical protein
MSADAETDLPQFRQSPIYDPTLRNFPETRPAATRLAEKTGSAMGISVKAGGSLRLQPVVDRFFFWLRASALETCRIANWWAECMLLSRQPLQEKMALFWHGHFATGADKVRDYRKMKLQLDLLRQHGTGNFRTLLVGVAQDPAMLAFLDAGRNVKDALNENFGREVMELFSMGVGNYTEKDVREAARAFTGWVDDDLSFRFDAGKHDGREKTFLGHTGPFDGVDVLDIILAQPVTADYIATKIYRFFVREDPSPDLQARLGAVLRDNRYEIKPFMRTIFLSRDFYSPASTGAQIKGPVELIVSTYRRLGLTTLPGIPDINSASGALGQVLLNPPTVAGWAQGRAWITPATLIARGNFAATSCSLIRSTSLIRTWTPARRSAKSITGSCAVRASGRQPPRKPERTVSRWAGGRWPTPRRSRRTSIPVWAACTAGRRRFARSDRPCVHRPRSA